MLSGATTDSSGVCAFQTTETGASVRLRYNIEGDPSFDYTAVSTTSAVGLGKLELTDLTADTAYEWQVEINGVLDETWTGRFRTHPSAPGEACDFTMAFSSCSGPFSLAENPSDHLVYTTIKDQDPLIFQHMGDLHYMNIGVNDPALFQDAVTRWVTADNARQMYSSLALDYVWDDHDYGPNDSNLTNPAKEAAKTNYLAMFPHGPLASNSLSQGVQHAYTVGRLRFIVTDQRWYRWSHLSTNPLKTLLGTAQKQWLKDEIAAAMVDENILQIVWVSPQVPYRDGGDIPAWPAYVPEIEELWDYFADIYAHTKLVIVAGDIHAAGCLVMDWATGTKTAPIPTIVASPIEQTSLFPNPEGIDWEHLVVAQGQHVLLEVVDNGVNASVNWKFYSTTEAGVSTLTFTRNTLQTGVPASGNYPLRRWDGTQWVRVPLKIHPDDDWDIRRFVRAVKLTETVSTFEETNVPPSVIEADLGLTQSESIEETTRARTLTTRIGASSVIESVGTGWTTPENAVGVQNGTFANLNSPGSLTPTTVTGTIEGSYTSLGAMTYETVTPGNLTVTFKAGLTEPTGGFGSMQIDYSLNNGGSWTNVATRTATSSGTETVSLALDVTNLSQFKWRIVGSVTGSTTTACIIQVDSVEIAVTHTGTTT